MIKIIAGITMTAEAAITRPWSRSAEDIRLYTATGRVRVSSVLSTWANIKLFQEKMKAAAAAVIMPGIERGRIIDQKALWRVAPSTIAESSSSTGTALKYEAIIHTTSGSVMNMWEKSKDV